MGLAQAWREPGTRLGLWTHTGTQFSGTVFALLWGVPYLVAGQGMTPAGASALLTLFVVVGIMAGPLFGEFTARHPLRRSWLVITVIVITAAAWTAVLATPPPVPRWLLVLLVVVLALGAPGSMIAFDYARTFNPHHRHGTAVGIVNIGGFVASLLVSFGVGVLLGPGGYTPRGLPGRLVHPVRRVGARAGRRARGPAAGPAQAGARRGSTSRRCGRCSRAVGDDRPTMITRWWRRPIVTRCGSRSSAGKAAGSRRARRCSAATSRPGAFRCSRSTRRPTGALARCWARLAPPCWSEDHLSRQAGAPCGGLPPIVILRPDGLGPVDGPPTCPSVPVADGVRLVATDAVDPLLDHLADGAGEYVVVDLAADGVGGGAVRPDGAGQRADAAGGRAVPAARRARRRLSGAVLRVLGNKTSDWGDAAWLTEQMGDALLGCVGHSAWIRAAERGTAGLGQRIGAGQRGGAGRGARAHWTAAAPGTCSRVARCRATLLWWSVPTRRAGGRSSCGLRSAPRWPR